MNEAEVDALCASLRIGDRVKFGVKREAEMKRGEGALRLKWWAADAVAFKVMADDGHEYNVIPEVGDELEKA